MVSREQVREALTRLYSEEELAGCALAGELAACRAAASRAAASQVLRRLLLEAVERLRPLGKVMPSASGYRAYECINMRYVTGLSVEEIADELSLGGRQVYRDLRWGENRLAQILASEAQTPGKGQEPQDALRREMDALSRQPEQVQLAEAVAAAVRALQPLAGRLGCTLTYNGPAGGPAVTATPGVLREALAQLISAALQNSPPGEMAVSLAVDGDATTLELPLPPSESLPRPHLLHSALSVLESQGVTRELDAGRQGQLLRLRFPLCGRHRVLVVEDNPATTALYERYLAGSEWQPVLADHPSLAGNLALAKRVQAVILDVMMPQADGWSVLQALKLSPLTRDIPVLVCSVVDDPELGRSLGADYYLTKPVTRAQLLDALHQALRPRSLAAAGPGRPR
jgi:CheY-like chemotaxis protein